VCVEARSARAPNNLSALPEWPKQFRVNLSQYSASVTRGALTAPARIMLGMTTFHTPGREQARALISAGESLG
jgi:hypothetical protein